MDRLTYWNEEYGCWSYHCASGDAAKRLADYEDLGRSPAELETDLAELAAYRSAEEAGLMVRLPCKPGETLFRIVRDGQPHIVEDRLVQVDWDVYGQWLILIEGRAYQLIEVGVELFLTRSEAEAALRKEAGWDE